MDLLTWIRTIGFLAGFVLVMLAEFRMRAPDAPALGSEGWNWPHRRGHIFTPAGFRVMIVGWVLWGASGVAALIQIIRG